MERFADLANSDGGSGLLTSILTFDSDFKKGNDKGIADWIVTYLKDQARSPT